MKSPRMWVWIEKRRDPGLRSLHSEVEEELAEDMRMNGEGGDRERATVRKPAQKALLGE